MKFPVAGIAASAGGLDAFSELLSALPPESGIAYVFIQHLDPDHESLLPEILGQRTPLPVMTAGDGDDILPDHVYVISPNTSLRIAADKLQVTTRPVKTLHHPGDIFFRSLADACGDSAIGIVLSGGDEDGALGTRAIKQSGGITFAQTPGTARFPSMPQSAIATGCVDYVMAPRVIGEELTRLGEHTYLRGAPAVRPIDGTPPPPVTPSNDENLHKLFQILRDRQGLDFSQYKRSTLQRRLARRMMLRRVDAFDEYLSLIETDTEEAAALHKDFLIRVTEFFREPESFEILRTQVFPEICENRSRKDPIRVWVPGCSSGEEVYSLAISLVEYLGDRLKPGDIQIFGTDVSELAIDQARSGRYLESIEENLSPERLARFFSKEDSHYRIAKSIRDVCVFARQDLTRDPPFSRLDLVSCRNVLIYLDAAVQRQVMQLFHYALRADGFLMLGHAESVGQAADLFEGIHKQHRLYRRKPVAYYTLNLGTQMSESGVSRPPGVRAPAPREAHSSPREADRLLLNRYAPPSLVIDNSHNVLQFRGETAPYLEHASGAPSLNLQRVLRTELLAEVMAAIQEARESKAEARRGGLIVDERRDVAVTVLPLQYGPEPSFLVLFDDGSRPPAAKRAHASPETPLTEPEKDRRLAQAEREVASTREFLQEAIERHDAIKEELKSAHEEVLSANEEFQSTNEELETSKEELQSANEELATTNEELKVRNSALDQVNEELRKAEDTSEAARAYADAIIETVREPLLVLQPDLTIIRANRSFYAGFKAKPERTIGRRLNEIDEGAWADPALLRKLDEVLSTDTPLNDLEVAAEFPRIGRHVMNLSARRMKAHDRDGELILLAIEDATARRATADVLAERNKRKDEFLAMLAHELRNPLTPIRHAVHLLRLTESDPNSSKLHGMIERQTNQLVHLVDELLDVARIGRGLIELKKERVDFGALIHEVCQATRSFTEPRQQQLSMSSPENAVYVYGDPSRLEQVVANLLSNASKYTNPNGNITVKLTTRDGRAVLSVKDDGIGLAVDKLEEIFELFVQVDRSLARSGGGLGLGLTVVRRVLDLHGGNIEARSAGPGRGSEFVVQLPLAAAAVAAVAPPQTVAPPDRKRRVLIVDDNEDAAETLAMMARNWGHEVAVAHDAPAAFALIGSFDPETALVDIGLPGMNGYDFARRLRDDPGHKNLYLVALTGYGRAEDREAARLAGFDVHVTKPVSIDGLSLLLATGNVHA